MTEVEEDYISLSALQHYAYCPRQCALIHIEQVWSENFWTAEGKLLHERVDAGESEQRGNIRTERSVSIISHRLKIVGKLDVLEIRGNSLRHYFPVEYKRGKPKTEDWDRIQLCAQALCLEEMLNIKINEAALWYWQVRQRESIVIDSTLRERTESIITATYKTIRSGITPRAKFSKKCKACSLIEWCEPNTLQHDRSVEYINELFTP